MKRKIASTITALIMLSAVMLIIGCKQPQGDTKNSDSGNTVSVNSLKGVWKVTLPTPNGATQYMMHVAIDNDDIYAAQKASSGNFVKYPLTLKYDKKQGTITIHSTNTQGQPQDIILTLAKNGDKIDLKDNTGKIIATMTQDAAVSLDTIKNAPAMSTPGPGPSPNQDNKASKQELQGVWKATSAGMYIMHIYFEDSTVYAATDSAGTFTKYPESITYNTSDGTLLGLGGTSMTPIKNGANIDLQYNGQAMMTMTKDTSVSGDTIKNATP